MYHCAAKNALYARQGRSATNDMASRAREMFAADASLTESWDQLSSGRWNHFMDQPHIGYTSFHAPPNNTMSAITLRNISVPVKAGMGVAIEGSESAWPDATIPAVLPTFNSLTQQRYFIDVFNQGQTAFNFTTTTRDPWVMVSNSPGTVHKQQRVWVSIQWDSAPSGVATSNITLAGAGSVVTVEVNSLNPREVNRTSLVGFAEGDRHVSMEAEHFTRLTNFGPNKWVRIEGLGHTLSSMRADMPLAAPSSTPGHDAACLEYRMYLFTSGVATVTTRLSPTLNFAPSRGLRYAVAFDDRASMMVTVVPQNYTAQHGNKDWEETVEKDGRHSITNHSLSEPGYHTLKVWAVDPGLVVRKIVVDLGGVKSSYLGPPESYFGANGEGIGR